MRTFIVFIFLFFTISIGAQAQNLVPNPSFETFASCPTGLSQLIICTPWDDPAFSSTTSDYFNACMPPAGNCNDVSVPNNFMGNALAKTGDGYAGFICKYSTIDLREYLQVQLSSPLVAGTNYILEFWIRRAPNCRYAVSNVGLLLSSGPAIQPGNVNISATPQLETTAPLLNSLNWTLVNTIYTAVGGEDYITIGSFRNDGSSTITDMGLSGSPCSIPNASAYYFVDDVRVEPIQEIVEILGDTLMCLGSTITLEADANVNFYWSSNTSGTDTLSLDTLLQISPITSTTYFLHGIQAKDSITVLVLPIPAPNLGADDSICAGSNIILDAGIPGLTYFWSTGQRTQTISVAAAGIYWVRVDNGACAGWDSIQVTILPNPHVELGPNRIFCPYLDIFEELKANTGIAWFWLPTSDTTKNVRVKQAGLYSVLAVQANGCTSSDSILVAEICPVSLYLPSGFTPNGDGSNDYFVPVGIQVESYKLRVFDRWGRMMFESDNQNLGWDGKLKNEYAPLGVYIWVCEFKGPDENGISKDYTLRGRVNLIR